MLDVMIDIEALGNEDANCIVQIGACYFNRVTGEIGRTFKRNIDGTSHEKYGGKLDSKTVYWWLAQSDAARKSILEEPREDIRVVFNDLNLFLADAKAIWSHLSYDWVTLTKVYKQLDIKPLFHYRVARDLRTIVDAAKLSIDSFKAQREGIHHTALDDAIFQVKYCVAALNKINKKMENNK